MSVELTSHERILKTIKGEKVDRVPVVPFDTFEALKLKEGSCDLMFATGEHLNDFTNGWKRTCPGYGEAVQFAVENGCDVIHRTSFLELDRRFLLIPGEFISVQDRRISNEILQREYTVKTPRGNLTYIEEFKKDISTSWIRKSLLRDKSDVEKILSVPYRFRKSNVETFFKTGDELGDRGVICCFVSTPIVCVSHLFDFNTFLLWVHTEKKVIEGLIDTVYERIYCQLEYLLNSGVGPLIEFGGSEQATPPMMSPELYDDFVVKYDSGLVDLVHRYGRYARVHCHGKVKTAIHKLLKMGADMLNPVEAPPNGDIEIHEAKKIVKGKMTLEGNIQFSDLEFAEEEQINILVKNAVCDGGKDRFILTATEWPLTYLSGRLKKNYIQFIKSGIEYGTLN